MLDYVSCWVRATECQSASFSVENLVNLFHKFLYLKQSVVQPVSCTCAILECEECRITRCLALSGSDCALLHLPSISLYPHSALPFCQQPSSPFHTLFWRAVPLVMLSPLSSHPLRYGTSTPAPTPFLSDGQPPTNDKCVSRWLFNNADKYRGYLEMTKIL